MTPDSVDTGPSQTGRSDESAHEKSGDRNRHQDSPHGDEAEIEASECVCPSSGTRRRIRPRYG